MRSNACGPFRQPRCKSDFVSGEIGWDMHNRNPYGQGSDEVGTDSSREVPLIEFDVLGLVRPIDLI